MSFRRIISEALAEDLGGGDITSRLVLDPKLRGKARIWAKEDLVLSGVEVARHTFLTVDSSIRFEGLVYEGDLLASGDDIAMVEGPVVSLLAAERVALNFLQRMCGIATLTAEYVKKVEGTGARIADTRKTAPGLRILDKMAVNTLEAMLNDCYDLTHDETRELIASHRLLQQQVTELEAAMSRDSGVEWTRESYD